MATAQDALNIMRSWLGMSRQAQTHHEIIDTYNSYSPLARGYKVTYWDDYCDVTVSAVFIMLGAVDLIGGTECGVNEHVKIFRDKGIWKDDRTLTPGPGWIIVFDFNHDKIGDHIGFVESVNGGTITTIEGNTAGGIVGRRVLQIGDPDIMGYAVPNYDPEGGGTYMFEVKVIKYGDKGNDVKLLQQNLNGRGFIDREKKNKETGDDGRVEVDGEWGDSTQRAFEYFQQKCRLKILSVCDEVRWKKLLRR